MTRVYWHHSLADMTDVISESKSYPLSYQGITTKINIYYSPYHSFYL